MFVFLLEARGSGEFQMNVGLHRSVHFLFVFRRSQAAAGISKWSISERCRSRTRGLHSTSQRWQW